MVGRHRARFSVCGRIKNSRQPGGNWAIGQSRQVSFNIGPCKTQRHAAEDCLKKALFTLGIMMVLGKIGVHLPRMEHEVTCASVDLILLA